MEYEVHLGDGRRIRHCQVHVCPWLPGFLDITPGDGGKPGLFNASEIRAIYEEPSDEKRPTSKLERIIRELEGEQE